MPSKLEETLFLHLRAAKLLTGCEREYRFAAMSTGGTGEGVRARLKAAGLKDWRVDFAYPAKKLAVEVEGGIFTGGRHTRGAGFDEDATKYNTLVIFGWRVLRFTTTSIRAGVALKTTEIALAQNWTQPWVIQA